ncbi:uncharacterized protein MONOS_519 [Monocercomonoides exilis]|uniref:uncharacterized protein n=1 Tax=Monocercomonoides exilis TaxID=2049356 RepID=UPI003559BB4D|nr:hypothetical protein MONOS_519 [Monocercomonoides exilis]|eukprot:MONOS_519.1-p1 / transcript=MONOS_519.1 / gene=MONOS_519 / organism=Monocercomonoides_exilis_PA203 / gene_product=unspecified product / transcript_product=unspecified product / location=Mono_scaffold00008:144220-146739(-) / protein_length=840 / sequence_SO=supercontig / SO=protein_coding / is_pseudo=false
MQDADQEVRTTGRQCYWLFNEIFPERTERIKTLIEYKILELLNTEKETLQSQINNHRQRIIDGNDAIAPPRLSSSKHLSSQSTLNTLSSSPRSMPSSPPSSQPLSCSQEPISLQPSPSFSAGSATVQTSSLPHPSSASSSLNDSHPNVRQASAITPPPPPPPPPPSAPLQLSPIDSHATTETSKTLIQISSRSHSPSLPSSFPSSLASSSESFHSIQNEDFQSISSAPFLPPHSCPLPPSPSLSLSPSTSPIPTFINSPSPSPPPPPPPLHLSTLSPTPFSNYTRSASSTPSSASPLPPPPSPPKSINCANLPLPPQQLPSEADIANKAVSPVPLPAIPTSAVQSTCLPTSSAPQNNVAKNADESSFHSAIPFSSNSFAKKVFEDSLQQSVIEPAKEAESSLTEDEARLLLTSTPTTQMNEDVFFSVVEAHFILPLQKHFAESRVSSISSVNSNNANNQEVIDSCERMFKLILSHHFPLLILPQKRTEDKDLLSFNSSSSSSDPSQPCSSFISSISSDSSSVHQTFSPCLLPLLQIFAYADDSAADSDSVLRISSLFDSFVVELVKNVGKTESSTSLQNENDDESAMQHDEHSAIEAATNLLHEFSEEPSRIEAMESSDFVASSSEQIKMVKTVLEAVHIQLEKCLKDNSNSLNANEDGNLESNSLVSAQKPSSSSSASASYPGESTSSQANSFQQHSPSNDKVVKRLLGFIVKIIEAFSESVSKSYLLNDISSSSSFSSSVKTDCFSSSDLPQNSVSEFISKIRSFLFYRFRNSILHLLSSSSSLLRMNVLDCVASILYKCTQMDLSPAIEPFSEAYKRLLKAHIQMKQSRQIVDGLL